MSHPDQDCERSLNASLRLNDDVTQGQRNRVIDQFVHGFSTWDWLYLRARVRQATLENHHLASITDLPAEVLGLVAAYLTLPEFLRCQSLSRRWRTMWSDPVILGGICERYYPGALRLYEHNVPVDQLLPYLIRISAQPAGKGWKASAITWNIGPEASSSRSREGIVTDKLPTGTDTSAQLFYAAGKVAWQSDPSFVVVDDLKENTWERISFLAGRLRGVITKLVAFSGELLVVGHPDKANVDQGSRASCRKIIVHHMSSKSQKFITLPNNLTHCVARGNRIICFTRGPQAFSLCWGAHLMELDMTIDEELEPHANERRIEDSVLFHPTQPETLFLVTIFAQDGEQESARRVRPRGRLSRVQCSITVTKFHDVTVIDRQRKPLEDVRYATSVYASNSRGLYALRFNYTNKTLAPHGNSIIFNTVTGQFATARFSSRPRGYELNEDYDEHYGQPILRLWNSHILLYYRADHVPPRLDHTGDTKPKASMILEAANCSWDRFGRSRPTDILYQDSPFDGLSQHGRFLGMQKSLHVSDDFVIMSSELGYVVLTRSGAEISLRQREAADDNAKNESR